jgi:hypothetical protein
MGSQTVSQRTTLGGRRTERGSWCGRTRSTRSVIDEGGVGRLSWRPRHRLRHHCRAAAKVVTSALEAPCPSAS